MASDNPSNTSGGNANQGGIQAQPFANVTTSADTTNTNERQDTNSTGQAVNSGLGSSSDSVTVDSLTGGLTFNQESPAALQAASEAVNGSIDATEKANAGVVGLAREITGEALDTAKQTLTPASQQGSAFIQKVLIGLALFVAVVFVGGWLLLKARKGKE
jgi:hypothetical protein